MAYNTAYDLESLVVNTKAATVYAAHENSLFLTGGIIPMIQLPAGSITAQVPVMDRVTAQSLTNADPDAFDDFTAQTVTDTSVTITANIYAARHVMRDLGGIDPSETGRVLGNAIQAKFDNDVVAAMAAFTNTQEIGSTAIATALTVDNLFDAAATIRGEGEMGQLVGVIGTAQAASLMKDIGSQSYAGGDFQSEAMRNGFLGQVAGIRLFQSSYVSGANKGFIMGADAMRIAMFKNVDLEIARRAEAVGNDIVANLHAGVKVIDDNRGVKLVDAV